MDQLNETNGGRMSTAGAGFLAPQSEQYPFAGFPVVDVYSGKRQMIVEQIQTTLRPKFLQNYLILDEVLLRDIRFSKEFQAAIEQKQVAQQASEQMVYERIRRSSKRFCRRRERRSRSAK